MANAKDLWVHESPKVMAVGESKAYAIEFSNVGTPSAVTSTTAYDEDGTDVSGTVLSGSNSLSGSIVTMKKLTPASAQNYRLVCNVTIGNNTVFGVLDVAVFAPAPAIGTITAGSYGAIATVAALVPRHASKAGNFDDVTNPTGVQAATFLDQVSAIIDTVLEANGFTTPVTVAKAKRILDIFADQEVASIVEGIHGAGRFGPAVGRGTAKGRWSVVMTDVIEFITKMAVGLEKLGVPRPRDLSSGIGFRDSDERGNTTFPLFQRSAHGDDAYQTDWDS